MTGRVDNISIFLNRCKIDWSLPKDEYVYVTEVIKDATYFFSGTDALFVEVATVKENQWSSIKRDYKGVNIRRSINYGFYFFTLDARKSGNLPRKYALARDPIRMLATPLTMCGSEPHRVILLLGASGSGKTTLLNHIPSYLKFADPETFFQSYEVCPFPPHKKTEEPRTFSFEHNLHVYTFVDTPGLNIGDSPEDNHRRMDHIMQSLLAFHSISTICITLNTFADSHSVLLPYQLRHWLSYLPVECCKSILFVASRANDDLRNKTLQKVLQKQLQLITSCRPDLDIRCRLLFFDNVAVDARNLRRTGPLVDSNYMNNAWSDSKAAFGSLVKEIADCEPILLKKCVDVLEQRRTFEDIAMSTKHATVEQEKMRDSLYRLRNRSYGNTNDSERIRCLNKTLKDLEKKKREDDNSARKSLEFLKSKSIVAFNICEAQYIYYLEKNKFPLKPAIADVWTWKKNLWTSTVQKENLVSRARNTLFCRTKKSEINAQIGFEELVYQGNNDGSNSSCIHKVLASVNQSYEGINIIVPTMPIIPAPYGTDRCSVAEDSRPVVDSSLLPEKKPCAKIKNEVETLARNTIVIHINNRVSEKRTRNIILVGASGAGKSTLINSLCVYLYCNSLEAAEKRVKLLESDSFVIPLKMTLYDRNGDPVEFEMGRDFDNELYSSGGSVTQRPQAYTFSFQGTPYRIIDIPGVPDTRGVFQDRQNFALVQKAFFHYDYINAVCFVLPPNASRLESSLKYGISEVFANIDRRLGKNVLFCYTKCNSTFFKVGATVPTIKKHLEGIRRIYNLDVDGLLSPGNRFLFDNESIEYLCARIRGTDIGETQENYERSYNKSYESAVRLLEKVAQMKPVVLEKKSLSKDHMLKSLLHLCFKLFTSTYAWHCQNEIVVIAADLKSQMNEEVDVFEKYLDEEHSNAARITAVFDEGRGQLEKIATQLSDYQKFHKEIAKYEKNTAPRNVNVEDLKKKLFRLRTEPGLSKCFEEYEANQEMEDFSLREIDFDTFFSKERKHSTMETDV